MPNLLAQVSIPYDSGIPTDVTVNTFSFFVPTVNETALTAIADRLEAFYNDGNAYSGSGMKEILAGTINGTASRLKIYNRADAEPRAPVYDELLTIAGIAQQALPAEVALCVSFRGPLVSGVPAARRRGRVFIGPLAVSAADTQSSGPTRPSTPAIQIALASMRALMDATDAVADFGVWSRTGAGGFTTAVHAWVDNAFDTMRSRGPDPSLRLSGDRSDQLP